MCGFAGEALDGKHHRERLQLDSGDTTTDGRRLFVGCNGGSLGPHQTII